MDNFLGKMVRQRRPKRKDGSSGDTAKVEITIDGIKKVYSLGSWGSVEAKEEYNRLAKEFYLNTLSNKEEDEITISSVYSLFLKELENETDDKDVCSYKTAIRHAMEILPDFQCSEINPRLMSKYQDYLVSIANEKRKRGVDQVTNKIIHTKKVWTRQYVNRLFNFWKHILKFGVNKGMIPYQFLPVILEFPPVSNKRGLTEKEKVEAVSDEIVLKTLPYLTPTVADMVKLIRGACMRPSECCNLRVGDLDCSKDCWAVRKKGKTSRFGYDRFIAFGIKETEIIKKRIIGKSDDDYVFSPRESQLEFWAIARANRKTKVQPSQIKRGEEAQERKIEALKPMWESNTLARSIARAINRANKLGANIPHWTPYQLRHASYTENSLLYGPETASKIAGHSSPDMAKVYDHSAEETSRDKASSRKAWWE